MSARRQLTALALVALAACACALPADKNPEKPLSNAVNKTPEGDKLSAANEAIEKSSVASAPAAPPKPVNERYPHAVLFGDTCGGSIISDKWILTAAHCTLFTGGISVLAGTNNSEDGSGVYRYVKKLHIHPLFTVGPYWLNAADYKIKQVAANWDFLLAELKEPLPLDGKTMAAIPLDDQLTTPVGIDADYAGYGTDHHGGTMRHEMHGMELSVQADEVCEKKLEQYRSLDMLCAKGRPPRFDSACSGDSGSGLVGNGKLLGIASWVENDAFECRNGNLVVFSRVARVRDWIKNITNI